MKKKIGVAGTLARSQFLLFAATMLLVSIAAQSVTAQSCTQGGTPTCGGCTAYNILYDPDFIQTSCNAWQFFPNAERALSGTMCNNAFRPWYAPFGRFFGPTSWSSIYQWTTAQSYGDQFWFTYTVDIVDPQNNPGTHVNAWIRTPGSYGYYMTIDSPPGGARDCDTRQIYLGHHPDWVGQQLAVGFDGFVPNAGATISINATALWQQ